MFVRFDISILLYPGVHDPSAIFGRRCGRLMSADTASQSRTANSAQKRSMIRLAAVSNRRFWRVHFVELRERGVEVSLFENLSAVDQATVEHREVDHAPLGIETLL